MSPLWVKVLVKLVQLAVVWIPTLQQRLGHRFWRGELPREGAHSKGYLQQPPPSLRLPQLCWPGRARCTCGMQDPSTQAFCPLSSFCVGKLSGSDEVL